MSAMRKLKHTSTMAEMIIATDDNKFFVFKDESHFQDGNALRTYDTFEECIAFLSGITWFLMERFSEVIQ